MTFGIDVKNQDGVTILDNTPFSSLEVIEAGTYTSGISIPIAVDPNAILFVRPSSATGMVYGSEAYTTGLRNISVNTGNIEYVKLRTCKNSIIPSSGFGLVIYDDTANPLLVFKDSMRYARLIASVNTSLGTLSIPLNPSFVGKKKYIAAHSLGIINFFDTFYSTVSATFSATDANITLNRFDINEFNAGGGGRILTRQFNIVEC